MKKYKEELEVERPHKKFKPREKERRPTTEELLKEIEEEEIEQ